jgi:hypothetical protein
MAQEFVINSEAIESKINQLLPSQGGFGAGVDFSASTMVIPIVDLTETASGSALRQDLQTSLGFEVTNTLLTTSYQTIVPTTGYYRVNVYGNYLDAATSNDTTIEIFDGTTAKIVWYFSGLSGSSSYFIVPNAEFVVFLSAGKLLRGRIGVSGGDIQVITRQIADINGNLINPT